jgi:asparagine synthase (glutamine-hydrolysing)
MCGILAYIGEEKFSLKKTKELLCLMKNRGPDNQEHLKFNFHKKKIVFFHSRLKIIDLKNRSNQPFIKYNKIMIYNGEIYNFKQIKGSLIKLGYKFDTSSDTEVLLTAYHHYGKDFTKHLNGMWAFLIYDINKKKIVISKDLFGEKPLFYYKNKKGFFFSSEIKYIRLLTREKIKINYSKIKKSLEFGYKILNTDNQTFFENIFSFPKASIGELDVKTSKLKINNFWTPKNKVNYKLSYKNFCHKLRNLMIDSLKKRIVADVPIAVSLSGGIDSSIIAGLIKKKFKQKKLKCFSLIDKGGYNEEPFIKKTENFLNIKSEKVKIKYTNFISNLRKQIKYHDQPISTITYFAQNFLIDKVSKKNFKVILSGTGADEQFTGYYDHFLHFFKNSKNRTQKNIKDWFQGARKFINNKNLKNPKFYSDAKNKYSNIFLNNREIFKVFKFSKQKFNNEKIFTKDHLRNRMLNEIFFEITPITLTHEDLNCMENSIENRSPFLDKNIFEFSNTIPTKFLISGDFQKKILRDTFKDVLDPIVRKNKRKIGFNASLFLFLEKEKENLIKNFFMKDKVMKNLIDMKKLYNNLENYKKNINLNKFLFSVISTKIFLESHQK